MSGIYVVFDPRGLEPARRDSFEARVNALAGRLPTDRLEFGGHAVAVMASVHHGHFASGGVASGGAALATVAGTCWHTGSAALVTPAELITGVPNGVRQVAPTWHGVFGLAHADEASCRLTVVSDRFGAHPLYWRLDAGILTVASSIRFLAEPGRDRPDVDVLADLLNFAYTPREETLLAGVRRLHAHHVLEAGADGVRTRPLPVPTPTRSRAVTDDAVRELDELVARGLRRHTQLPGGPARGAFSIALSGGLDSRLVAGAAKRVGFAMQGFTVGERRSLEAHTAARVADGLGIPNASLLVDGATLPDWFRQAAWFTEGRTGADHMHYLGPAFSGRLPAGPQLHGLIGEGIIGGYEERLSLVDATPAERLHACRAAVRDMVWWPAGRARQVLSPALAGSLEQARARVLDEQERRIWRDGTFAETVAFTFQTVTVGFRVPNLVSQVTPWTDVVSPFLDGELLDFAGTLDPHGMADRALQIRWGLDCMPGFDAVPRLKDGVLIPVRLGIPHYYDEAIGRIWRRKRLNFLACRLTGGLLNPPDRGSFPYFGQWYRRWPGVRRFVDGILLDERSLDRGLWNREGLRLLLRDLRTGREVWPAVGTLLLCEMLLRQWCDGVDRPADQVTPLLANSGEGARR
ncbi:MAG: hypothetical protein IPO18_04515 [bacterium]|nr:hypothetical protein [bacterium]